MQKHTGSCSPEQLRTLQRIFDLIWMDLRSNGSTNYNGPSDPDDLRDEIARRVFHRFDGNGLDVDGITQRVLSSFGIPTDSIRAQTICNNGAGKRDGG